MGIRMYIKKIKSDWVLVFILLLGVSCTSELKQTHQEQVISGELPDPSVIKVGEMYYASGSSNNWGPFYPIYQSKDLKNWEFVSYVFDEKPEWTMDSYWAPELYYEEGIFYCYYTARRTDGVSCIGVATTDDITQGFTDHGVIVEWGNEAIDAYVYKENGTKYLTWKAYGLTPDKPIQILGSELTEDGLKLEGEAFEILTAEDNSWEKGGIEGQCILKQGEYIYMLYSGNACCGAQCNYQVGVARAKSIKGPWGKNTSNPILVGNETWNCPGHGTAVNTNGEWQYLYHAYHSYGFPYLGRVALLSTLYYDENSKWPYFNLTEENIKKEPLKNDLMDTFDAELADWWRYDVSTYIPVTEIMDSQLFLKDEPIKEGQHVVSAIVAVPEYGDFECQTVINKPNQVMSGLVYYATHDRSVGLGVKSDRLIGWRLEGENFEEFYNEPIRSEGPVYLRSSIKEAHQIKFYYSTDNKTWKAVPSKEPIKADHLSWWSWGMKVGLFVKADEGAENRFGTFGEFSLEYQ